MSNYFSNRKSYILNKYAKGTHSVLWTVFSFLGNQGLVFVGGLILSRLLPPSVFGEFSYLIIFILFGESIIYGLSYNHLISLKKLENDSLNTAFILSIVFGAIYALVMYLLFKDDFDFYIILFTLVGIPIDGALSIYKIRQSYLIDFKSQSLISIISGAIALFASWLTAVYFEGILALVVLRTTPRLIALFLFPIWVKWVPRFSFSRAKGLLQLKYSWKYVISSGVSSLGSNFASFLIRNSFGVIQLGYYSRAYSVANIPGLVIGDTVSRVTIPLMAKLNIKETKYAVQFTFNILIFLSVISGMTLMLFNSELIRLLLGPGWEESAFYLRLLCFPIVLYPVQVFMMTILVKERKNTDYLALELLKKSLLIVCVLVGVKINVEALIVALALAATIGLSLNYRMIKSYGHQFRLKVGYLLLLIYINLGICFASEYNVLFSSAGVRIGLLMLLTTVLYLVLLRSFVRAINRKE